MRGCEKVVFHPLQIYFVGVCILEGTHVCIAYRHSHATYHPLPQTCNILHPLYNTPHATTTKHTNTHPTTMHWPKKRGSIMHGGLWLACWVHITHLLRTAVFSKFLACYVSSLHAFCKAWISEISCNWERVKGGRTWGPSYFLLAKATRVCADKLVVNSSITERQTERERDRQRERGYVIYLLFVEDWTLPNTIHPTISSSIAMNT